MSSSSTWGSRPVAAGQLVQQHAGQLGERAGIAGHVEVEQDQGGGPAVAGQLPDRLHGPPAAHEGPRYAGRDSAAYARAPHPRAGSIPRVDVTC
jgi:hypothetical protein